MRNDTERTVFFIILIAFMALGILAIDVTLYFFTINK